MMVDYLSSQPDWTGYQVSTKRGSGPASGFSRLVYIHDEDCGILLACKIAVLAFTEGFGVSAVHTRRDLAGFVAPVSLFKVARI